MFQGNIRWAPRKPLLKFTDVPDAPLPGQTSMHRIVQMKNIIGAILPPSPIRETRPTLRPMPRPIDRYSDAAAGQADGAIFIFASGTNPEVMVLIEAQGPLSRRHAGATRSSGSQRLRTRSRSIARRSGPSRTIVDETRRLETTSAYGCLERSRDGRW